MMVSLATSRIRIAAFFAGAMPLAIGSSGCIDTTKWSSRTMVPPQETPLAHEAGAAGPNEPIEIMNEVNLVQNMTFHRAMYARLLGVLATYYSEQGYPEKAAWARTELSGLQQVKTYKYIPDAQLPGTAVSSREPTSDDSIVPAVHFSDNVAVTLVAEAESNPPEAPSSLAFPAGVATPDIPIENLGEADLVENLMFHRTMYTRLLTALTTYYSEHGPAEKAAWAQTELIGVRRIKTYRYIIDAEVPRADLMPTTSIAEADKLYDDGMRLLRKGGRGFPCFYNQATMRLALAKFKELISKYPTSDKIDDAAYYIAEIHKEYEKERDNSLAIEWYKRAIQWDPNTPHPCRFRIATTYDYRLHDREQALYWYQKVLEEESKFTSHDDIDFAGNTRYSQKRIRELTPEEHLRSPAGTVPGGPAVSTPR